MQMAQLPSNSRLQQDELATQLTEHGKFSELLHMNVPCPADPETVLVSVLPSVRSPYHRPRCSPSACTMHGTVSSWLISALRGAVITCRSLADRSTTTRGTITICPASALSGSRAVLQRCRVFKSARSPVRFAFSAASSAGHAVSDAAPDDDRAAGADRSPHIQREPVQMIFKNGDDLRQDQFVCQVCTP